MQELNIENAARSRVLSYEEQREIAHLIVPYHGVFYKFWNIVSPSFVFDEEECPTAQVRFNRSGNCIDFEIGHSFWEGLTDEQKTFVVCHECLHVMLKHGTRMNFKEAIQNPTVANMALDIPINHMLVDYFGFDRNDIDPESKSCWIDTVFSKDEAPTIERGKNFEYYFLKIKNSPNTKIINVPNHAGLPSMADGGEDQMQDAADEMTDEEKQALKDISDREDFKNVNGGGGDGKGEDPGGKLAGSEAGMFKKTIQTSPPQPKRKWETIVKKWAAGFVNQTRIKSHWIAKPRRMAGFDHNGIFIPSSFEMPKRTRDDKKIQVWLFQDTSGSCVGLASRFFKAFESLPKAVFEVKAHCFDTRVFELSDEDLKNKTLYGFGGTTFSCIENFIQNKIKKTNCEHPKAVFVLTDGYAGPFKAQKPRNWYWFLSENYTNCIPKESKRFMLSEFE